MSGEQASELSSVFGVIEPRTLVLLFLLRTTRSQYDLLPLVDPGGGRWKLKDDVAADVVPREYRIPRATLYRIVPELETAGFIVVERSENRVTGKQTTRVNYYGLTLKGKIAALLGAYIACSQQRKPNSKLDRRQSAAWSNLKRKALEWIREYENDEYWPIAIDFLEWHRRTKTDLSQAQVSPEYAFLTSALRAIEREDQGETIESDEIEGFLTILRDYLLDLTVKAFEKRNPEAMSN
ncbi:MAG: hypothetical protein ABSE39_03755 [Candidatus Bathyarchaeia archaeon]